MNRLCLILRTSKSGETIRRILSEYARGSKDKRSNFLVSSLDTDTSNRSLFLLPDLEFLAKEDEIERTSDSPNVCLKEEGNLESISPASTWENMCQEVLRTLQEQEEITEDSNSSSKNNIKNSASIADSPVDHCSVWSPGDAELHSQKGRCADVRRRNTPDCVGFSREANDETLNSATIEVDQLLKSEVIMHEFKPPITVFLTEKVRHAIQIAHMLTSATELVSALESAPVDSPTACVDVVWQWLSQDRHSETFPYRVGADGYPHSVEDEYAAGIAARLKLPASTSRQRIRAVVSHPNDAQVNEVLPNSRVVTFTSATLPHHVLPHTELRRALDDSLKRLLASSEGGSSNEQRGGNFGKAKTPLAPLDDSRTTRAESVPAALSLHMVVHRERTPWGEVAIKIRETVEQVCGQGIVRDVSVNLPLSDGMVVTHTCSVSLWTHVLLKSDSMLLLDTTKGFTSRPNNTSSIAVAGGRGACLDDPVDALLQRLSGSALYAALSRLNVLPLPFGVQLLGWRPFACDIALAPFCRKQYSLLLRGIQQHARSLESTVQKASLAVPNFFPVEFFGPLGCPIRTYHVAAAIDAGRIREALAMLYGLLVWLVLPRDVLMGRTRQAKSINSHMISSFVGDPSVVLPSYAHKLVQLLQSGEDRPAYLRRALEQVIPSTLWTALQQSKASLLWNVMASCRIQSWSAQRAELLDLIPEIGDFVTPSPIQAEEQEKKRRNHKIGRSPNSPDEQNRGSTFRHTSCGHCHSGALLVPLIASPPLPQSPPHRSSSRCIFCDAVRRVQCVEDATGCTVFDVVLPLLPEGSQGAALLSQALGFPTSNDPLASAFAFSAPTWSAHSAAASFRAVVKPVSGFPHAAKPWVRALAEPPAAVSLPSAEGTTPGDEDENDGAGAGRVCLSSDRHLASSPAHRFTTPSRGRRGRLWPIGTSGHTMVERLPAGLLASSDGLKGAAAPSYRNTASPLASLKCLAIHCTVAGDMPVSNLLREFALIHVALPPLAHLPHHQRSSPWGDTAPSPSTSTPPRHDESGEVLVVGDQKNHIQAADNETTYERPFKGEEHPPFYDGNVLAIPTRGTGGRGAGTDGGKRGGGTEEIAK